MRRSHWSVAAFGRRGRFGTSSIPFVLSALACTTTLDPSVVVDRDDAGTGGAPDVACTYFTSGMSEYVICPQNLTHQAAAADCALKTATLIAVGSAGENDVVIAARAEVVPAGDLWLGGARNDAYVWSWPDGTVFWRGGPDGMADNGAFAYWKPGEPNNASTTSPNPERCLAITPGGDWNDRACELRLPYICERPSENF